MKCGGKCKSALQLGGTCSEHTSFADEVSARVGGLILEISSYRVVKATSG